jgi:hypothetical protein
MSANKVFSYSDVTWLIENLELSEIQIDQSSYISKQVFSATAKPLLADTSILFEEYKKSPSWAFFLAPQNFLSSLKYCFKMHLVPNFSAEESIYLLEEKANLTSLETQEKKKLLSFLKTYQELDELCHFITYKCLQYHKG